MPLDVLLGTGEALRTNRPDVLDELVRRATPHDPATVREQLVHLHTAVAGRLLAVVAATDTGAARAGWVSWLLFGDGWRSLTPVRRDGRPFVAVAGGAARPGRPGRRPGGAGQGRQVTVSRRSPA